MITTRRNPTRTCGEKLKFTYAKDADRALKNLIEKGVNRREKLHVYYCPYCLYWHIGHC